MKLATAYLGIGLLTLAGCSSEPAAASDETRNFRGEVRLDVCEGERGPELVRCGGDAAPGLIAAVCGDFATQDRVTVNGSLAVGGQSRIASPLRVSSCFTGFGGIRAESTEEVAGDLATAFDWVVDSAARVGANVLVGGKLHARNAVAVGGVLHAAAVDMTKVSASVVVDAMAPKNPLHCELASQPSAIISGLESATFVDLRDALAAHSEAARVQLGCARYRFDSFGIDQELTLHIKGHTLIVVDGNVRIAAPLTVELEPDAQLDFLIGGALEVNERLSFSKGTTWLAVGGALSIAAPLELDGTLYAPGSAVSSTKLSADKRANLLTVNGALLVGSLSVASPVAVSASSEPPLPACRRLE